MSASREKEKRKELAATGQLTRKEQEAIELSKQKKKTRRNAIIIVAIVVIVVAVFCVVYDTIPFFSGRLRRDAAAYTVGETEFSAADFNYYYFSNVKQYEDSYGEYFSMLGMDTTDDNFLDTEMTEGQTWGEYFEAYTKTQLDEIGYLVNEANAAGFTLSEEELAALTEQFDYLADYCASLGMSIDSYYESIYGRGVTDEVYRRNATRSNLAGAYKEYVKNSFTYGTEELETYYAEHTDDVDTVDYNYFFMSGIVASGDDTTTEEAMAKALSDSEAFVDRMAAGESFYDLAYEYAREISKDRYTDKSASLRQGATKSATISEFAEWLFSAERKAGDVTIVEGNPDNSYQGYFVVEFLNRERADYNTVNYRNILVSADVDDEATYTEANAEDTTAAAYEDYVEAQWATAETTVDEIIQQWQTEGGTEDDFATVAGTRSGDTDTYADGGWNAQAYKYQLGDEIDAWLFDEARQPGDYEVFETSEGYEILYFVGTDLPRWQTQIIETLSQADYDAWYATLADKYVSETKKFGMFYALTK